MDKFQVGTWVAHKLCSQSHPAVFSGMRRIKVYDMSDVVRRTAQQFDGKSYLRRLTNHNSPSQFRLLHLQPAIDSARWNRSVRARLSGRKRFQTINQFVEHLTDDVLPKVIQQPND